MNFPLPIGRPLYCETCKAHQGHKKNCPVPAILGLEKARRYNLCPLCHADGVDFNQAGLWECRYCHTQFEKIDDSQAENCILMSDDLDQAAGFFKVKILAEQGSGDFPIDKEIERLRAIAYRIRENNGKD